MKLHPVNRKFPMLQAHDFARVGLGRDLERIRERIAFHNQRMITSRFERLGQDL